MHDQPDPLALSVGDGSDGLLVPETRYREAIHNLEDASFGHYRAVGRLVKNAPQGVRYEERGPAVTKQ